MKTVRCLGGPIRCRSPSIGVSLVELLVCLGLGALVSVGAVRLLLTNLASYQLLHAQVRVHESGRLALDLMAGAIRAAGHLGCAHHGVRIQRRLTGTWEMLPEVDVTRPVQTYGVQSDGGWRPGLDGLPGNEPGAQTARFTGHGLDTRRLAPDSDLLVVSARAQPALQVGRRAGVDGLLGTPFPGADELAPDDIVLIGDCVDSAAVRVTHLESTATQQRLRWQMGGPVAGLPVGPGEALYRNDDSGDGSLGLHTLLDRADTGEITVGRIEATFFFVAPGLDRNALGEPLLALWQKVGAGRPTELVAGIERIRVRLLVSHGGAGDREPAARYVDASGLVAGMQIRSLELSVVASSIEPVEGGVPIRREFRQSVAMRNQVDP